MQRLGRSDELTDPSAGTGDPDSVAQALQLEWAFPVHQSTPLVGERLLVGRSSSCDVVLDGREVSRTHAEIRVQDGLAIIRDVKSRNGVRVNGVNVTEAPLAQGDVVRLGDWLAVVTPIRESTPSFAEIAKGWWGSASLIALAELARKAASSDVPIVIQGATGTGKEGLARAVHAWSKRQGAFVAINCTAIPLELFEAEFFGYRRGAFTGANQSSKGHFRAADHGTLFLDEIVDLPLAAQAKFLRVLEQREVHPLGEKPTPVNVRIVAATQETLKGAVKERRFRADLEARLDVVALQLPTLRDRRQDIVPLFLRHLRDSNGGHLPHLEPSLVEKLLVYDWPANVRELVQLSRRLLALHGSESTLKSAFLPKRFQSSTPEGPGTRDDYGPSSPTSKAAGEDDELEKLMDALRSQGGNLAAACASIGMSRGKAYRLLGKQQEIKLRDLRLPLRNQVR
jgi:transcriptional regulator with PAS, ATPase and Fis domain